MIKLKDLLNEDRTASIIQHHERELQKILDKPNKSYRDEEEIQQLRNAIAYAKSKQESVNEKWQTFKGLRILPSGATGDVVYFKNKKEMMKAFKEKKAKPIHEDVSPKGWNMSKKYIKFIDREVKNLKKYHRQQNEEDFLEVANYIELQLKQMKKDLNESINQKTLMKEGVDLYSHVKAVEQHLDDFRKDLDRKRGGSYESDSVEYEDDRWYNDSKKLKGRDKKLGQWEKKVKKSLDNLIKDFEKAWK